MKRSLRRSQKNKKLPKLKMMKAKIKVWMKVFKSVRSVLRIESSWKKLNQKVMMSKLVMMMKIALWKKKWRQVTSSQPVNHGKEL